MSLVKFENSFQRLPDFFYERVDPTPIKNARLIHVGEMKMRLGLQELSDQELTEWLNGERYVPGEQRIATRYAGHQFGVWAGQLGDGRAISIGELFSIDGSKKEIQTKGSGVTPFSRMGDGKAVIRSSVREYLCSIAMSALGVPTTEVLALLIGDDPVERETIERSALVARVFPTNIRFGHFEAAYHFRRPNELNALIDYVRETFFDGISVEGMLREVVKRTAIMIARWQDVGFCHGVMNTDNMSILGLTLDYGPFGFLEDTNLQHICNHTDSEGRYAYDQQANIAAWNLERLFVCFRHRVPIETLKEILDSFPFIFRDEYLSLCRTKLGLFSQHDEDQELVLELLRLMQDSRMDYTFLFRQLSSYQRGKPETLSSVFDRYGKQERLLAWLRQYDLRLDQEVLPETERIHFLHRRNPKFILRNYIAQEVIDSVERNETEMLQQWITVLSDPFSEHPEFDRYPMPTPNELKHFEVSCSS